MILLIHVDFNHLHQVEVEARCGRGSLHLAVLRTSLLQRFVFLQVSLEIDGLILKFLEVRKFDLNALE